MVPRVKGVSGPRKELPVHWQQDGAQTSSLPPADHVDQAILNLLLFEPGFAVWGVEEIVREIGSPIAVDESLWRLHRVGLIHRLDEGFVFASRAAARAAALLDPGSEQVSWTGGSCN